MIEFLIMTLLKFILGGSASMLFLWIYFIIGMKFKRKTDKNPTLLNRIILKLITASFVLCDGLFNIVYGTFMYLRKPDFKGAHNNFPLFTHRLITSLQQDEVFSWRFEMSLWICLNMVEPHDEGHCKLHLIADKLAEAGR